MQELLEIKKMGKQSIPLEKRVSLVSTATVAGPKESLGPLTDYFDRRNSDNIIKEKSFEKAEAHMLEESCFLSLGKVGLTPGDIDFFIAGDLLNQIISANICARKLAIPYFGIYGACSTLTEGMSLGTLLIEGGFAEHVLVGTSSHNSTAERQYRYPTEYGYQPPGYSQQTVTGAGAVVLGTGGKGPAVESITVGKVVDPGITDAFDLGSAMSAAAVDTIYQHFMDTQRGPSYYDLILTGDLGAVGSKLTQEALASKKYYINSNYIDCGNLLYHSHQNTNAGGSGCATSALVFLGYIYHRMINDELKKVLLVTTGALHSPTTVMQGESIPAVAHALALEV